MGCCLNTDKASPAIVADYGLVAFGLEGYGQKPAYGGLIVNYKDIGMTGFYYVCH